MKKFIKPILCLLIVLSVIFSFFNFSTFAAGSIISFNKKNLTVGDSLTVSLTVNAGEAMYGVSCIVNYDSNVLEYKSGNASGGAGTLKIVESPSGDKKVTYTLTFTAKTAGSCAISVEDCVYSALGENGSISKSVTGASASVSVKDAALSSNANLSSLSVSKGSLSPAFSQGKINYTVTVGNDVTECSIYATAADSDAKVEVSSNAPLVIGDNKRTITVTAPNGTQKVYTVTIKRTETATTSSEAEDTSSDETSSEELPLDPTAPLHTVIDGVEYSVLADISNVKLFKGFEAVEVDYNGSKIYVAEDSEKNYSIYYLKSSQSEEAVPYTYDEEQGVFNKLQYTVQGENSYIFADIPNNLSIPEDYYNTNVEISSFSVRGLADNRIGMSDFYYVYCYSDGLYSFYRYDSKDNIIQRYPELTNLVNSKDDAEPTLDADAGFVERFNFLSNNAKLIIIGSVALVLLAIALIVLLIIKFVRGRNDTSFDEDYLNGLEFDDITLNDSFIITDEDEDTDSTDNEDENTEVK